MMICIKCMEMPPDGRYTLCITHDSNGGVHWVFQNQDTLGFLEHGNVIEVQEPHGRLIDASAAYDKIAEQEGGNYVDMDAVGMGLDETPTVVTASEGVE